MTNLPSHSLRVNDLPQNRPTRFALTPDAAMMAAIATELGLTGLRKLSFRGEIVAEGRRDWRMTARLGATVVQNCVLTLVPVTTRIDENVERRFLAEMPPAPEGEEMEMPEDDTIEPLGPEIDPARVMIEALALALPLYPRAEGATMGEASFTEPGKTALTDADAKPFAGLAALRAKLTEDD
ncbi:YceD family protein [Thalassovita taeanensis]|uniref:Uncharacterized metal-binding protein YceD, DUF177 family n=1 Tax=Thalassovita taeanensis TaxID=657014 RepID=A0A1H8YTA6_9RHOB|nr:DUF177 domain-containing protein [Thalassovita taeanensis]SEP55367.1 Uncharacterized metal-binding protein YceD, DUF177 family [Thalassovita taeanensis]